jgi:hypothetical protein
MTILVDLISQVAGGVEGISDKVVGDMSPSLKNGRVSRIFPVWWMTDSGQTRNLFTLTSKAYY